ncbi:ParA family protein [Lichenifustis flavocetrariae]|uniref:ParA family protein n=1 Tax=Lichenifustis flavocetrariae TaxID=2949735 RepID=A0AA41Z6T4_9HYPH|nr:ParA family protein [Lichenifustis flavocetrariae]MCW6511558.1 ParA family protein [Lichenifustis flavocetrariae]
MPTQVIAIANCKGGTGKTTTTVNLAAEMAHRGRRVLLVDLDAQGHAGLGFGVFADQDEATAHQVFRRSGVSVVGAIRRSATVGLDILPADPTFRNHGMANDPRRLAQALTDLGDRYDTILIDTPPSADLPLVAALAAAHCVLVPSQLTHLAHHGLVQFSRLFFNVATGLNPLLNAFAIVPVQVDMRMHLQQKILAKLLQDFGPERIFRGIRTDVALAEAFGAGCPVRNYRPTTRGARDYNLLADDVSGFWTH